MIDGCSINTRLSYNPNTDHIWVGSIYQYQKNYQKEYYINNKDDIDKRVNRYQHDNSRIVFLNKRYYTHSLKVKEGYLRHHYIYDHANPNLYTTEMKISDHTKLHNQMKKDKVEISHINVRVNDFKGF